MSTNSLLHFVVSSSVRVDVVRLLGATPETTDGLLDRLDASQSSVYTAVADLERRDVVVEADGGLRLTGQGRLLLDLIDQWESIEQVVATDSEYWATHRTDVIPRQFRRRLPELGEYEVIRSEPPDVRAHARAIVSGLERVDSCSSAVTIYAPEFEDAFPDGPESRLLLAPRVLDVIDERENGLREQLLAHERTPCRVRDLDFGFSVAPEFVMVALQPQSENMVESILRSTDDAAIQWGEQLFDHLWRDAEPLDSYLQRHHY